MLVREITQTDNQSVKKLIQSSLKKLGFDKPGTAYYDPELNDLYTFYKTRNKAMYWVVEEEGKIVGGVGIAPFKDNICELQKLYVSPEIQGKGLA
ncbi:MULTISPECIES: GNAT family N-acetyltransferase [Vagococcus]|uniref:Acetyltransferase, GNAT family n=1 Tax=Vagococcus fluvialis bH819 TaxID=1255619 RepID=A0A1X6WKC9_9ENTE|nr:MULTISPECIES: GNAT family N-acetyltransferase [Vagococcus]SLM84725.1 Acetyltransferase, GNAT family [Vagococcus fluvialis bH819]